MSKDLRKKIRKAVGDTSLRNALENLGATYPEARALAYKGVDFEALREKIENIKNFSIENIESLADSFEEKVRQQGGKIYRAKDGSEVVEIIKKIAEKRKSAHSTTRLNKSFSGGPGGRFYKKAPLVAAGGKIDLDNQLLCVKSKSMTSEEIHLNEKLKNIMNVIETDLGEWIVQQIKEKPSHIVMPAIHLTKEKCAEIFSGVVGHKVKPDITGMVKLARKILRSHFLQADIGISGCNIAVAQTGTMVIFTNEGNGRLTATLPPVHIVLLGYEKLVPELKDIAPIVNALPKSATGQVITSYITMISGPSQTLAEPKSDRLVSKELHVILLDNGRLQMLKDPVFQEIGRCIRCASCLNVCPVYQLLSGQVYGFIYSGGIGSLLTAFLNSREKAEEIEALCLNCGRCSEVCPAKINIPGLTLKMRSRIRQDFPPPFLQKFIAGNIVPAKRIFNISLRSAAPVSRVFAAKGKDGNSYIKKLPFGLKKIADWRPLPALAKKPFRDIFKKIKQEISLPYLGQIAFFAGCMIDYVYPEIGESIVRLLNNQGYEVIFPEQTCCGAPAFYSGLPQAFEKSARQNIKSIISRKFDYIVTPCPTCTVVLKKDWQELLEKDPAAGEQARTIAGRTYDFVELYYKLKKEDAEGAPAKNGEEKKTRKKKIKITYHYSCHLKRASGVHREPAELLSSLPGFEWVEMEEADRCCGFAGTYSLKFPEISCELLERKIRRIEESGAEIVAVDCPGCLLNLRGGLEAQKSPVRAYHSAVLLDPEYFSMSGHPLEPG